MKTSNDVSALLGLSRRRVLQAAKTMGLSKHGRDYVFDDAAVDWIRGRIGQRGRRLA